MTQPPESSSTESIRTRLLIAIVAYSGSVTMHHLDKYREHWWWDNLSHLIAGYAIGWLLPGDRRQVDLQFLLLATIWEALEWAVGMPYSMGDNEWPIDRRVEDTLLDTVVGLVGARLAHRMRSR